MKLLQRWCAVKLAMLTGKLTWAKVHKHLDSTTYTVSCCSTQYSFVLTWSWILGKLIVIQLIRKFPFNGTQSFITTFMNPQLGLILSQLNPIYTPYSILLYYPPSTRSLLSGLFLCGVSTKILYAFLNFVHMHTHMLCCNTVCYMIQHFVYHIHERFSKCGPSTTSGSVSAFRWSTEQFGLYKKSNEIKLIKIHKQAM
jgi:hypothetical protein